MTQSADDITNNLESRARRAVGIRSIGEVDTADRGRGEFLIKDMRFDSQILAEVELQACLCCATASSRRYIPTYSSMSMPYNQQRHTAELLTD